MKVGLRMCSKVAVININLESVFYSDFDDLIQVIVLPNSCHAENDISMFK